MLKLAIVLSKTRIILRVLFVAPTFVSFAHALGLFDAEPVLDFRPGSPEGPIIGGDGCSRQSGSTGEPRAALEEDDDFFASTIVGEKK